MNNLLNNNCLAKYTRQVLKHRHLIVYRNISRYWNGLKRQVTEQKQSDT